VVTRAARRTVLGVVVLAALIIATWPRAGTQAPTSQGAAAASSADVSSEPAGQDPGFDGSTQGGPPCPTGPAAAPSSTGPLRSITLPCMSGPGRVDLGSALTGQPVLINLWASWCAPCREEMPVLSAYTQQPAAIAVLGVQVQDKPANGRQLMADLHIVYPSATDPDGLALRALQAPPVLPASYLVRADGSTVRITDPLVFRSADAVRRAVTSQGG
jgi:thiol-disulfide isomerase/thioredoxin